MLYTICAPGTLYYEYGPWCLYVPLCYLSTQRLDRTVELYSIPHQQYRGLICHLVIFTALPLSLSVWAGISYGVIGAMLESTWKVFLDDGGKKLHILIIEGDWRLRAGLGRVVRLSLQTIPFCQWDKQTYCNSEHLHFIGSFQLEIRWFVRPSSKLQFPDRRIYPHSSPQKFTAQPNSCLQNDDISQLNSQYRWGLSSHLAMWLSLPHTATTNTFLLVMSGNKGKLKRKWACLPSDYLKLNIY